MASSNSEFLTKEWPAALNKNSGTVREFNAKYQLNLTGEGGGSWLIDTTSTGPSIKAEQGHFADCTISMSSEDFQRVRSDQTALMPLFFSGKMKVSGDQMKMAHFSKLLSIS